MRSNETLWICNMFATIYLANTVKSTISSSQNDNIRDWLQAMRTRIQKLPACIYAKRVFFILGHRAPARDRDEAYAQSRCARRKNNLSRKTEVSFYHIKFDLAASPLSIKISCAVIDLLTAATK